MTSAALVLSSILAAAPAAATEDVPVPVEQMLLEESHGASAPASDATTEQTEGDTAPGGGSTDDAVADGPATDASDAGGDPATAEHDGDEVERDGDEHAPDVVPADDGAEGEPGTTDDEGTDEGSDADAATAESRAPLAPRARTFSLASVATAPSVVAAGNVESATASWGISQYLTAGSPGRPKPIPVQFTGAASYDATTRTASWGAGIGEVEPDGSATLGYTGLAVVHAPTGGGWLRFADPEVVLDSAGNGVLTAVASYGTASPPAAYDPAQAAVNGPQRINVLAIVGNSVVPTVSGELRTWSGLQTAWHDDLLAFLAGSGEVDPWRYASTITNLAADPSKPTTSWTDRNAQPLTLTAQLEPTAPTFEAATYDLGTASWGMSTYLSATNFGRPNPLPSAYVAPASFDETTRIATWGGGSGSVAADGTASLAFEGTSVNFAKTGGGWLRVTDIEASLDAAGNGAVTAIVAYGTAPGAFPNIAYDAAQPPTRGPQRMTLVTLTGNASPVVQGADTATWTGLAGIWHADFLAFLAGDGGAIEPWSYATTLDNVAADRLPSTFDFQLGIRPPAVATTTALRVSPATSIATGTTVSLTAIVTPSSAAGTVKFRSGATVLGAATVSGGTATAALSGLAQGAHSVTAHFVPADATAFTASQSAATTLEVLARPPVVAGSLTWGIKSSFGAYITGLVAQGTITTSGVGTAGGVYQFGQSGATGLDAAGIGSVRYSGSVRYYGHAGALDLTFTDPSVTVHSPSSATLYVTVNGVSTALAALALDSGVRTANGWAGVPATLTAAGSAAFDHRYAAGEGLDPVTFVSGAASGPLGGTTAIASAPQRTAEPTPPATDGIQLVGDRRPAEGEEVTITADGFEPNEEGILVVIYSTPVVLGTANADAMGTVTWTGKLPKGLSGKHTLTLQGSVDRGLVVEIAPVTRALSGCVAESASLTWGLKESWRSYVSGSIAHGQWEVAGGATYSTPVFGWEGTGTIDPRTLEGVVELVGSVRFTGHDGALDTTLIDPVIEFDGDRGTIRFDVEGENRAGEAVTQAGVAFGELDLAAADVTLEDGVLTLTGIPAVLTAAGGQVISYPAGEALDPLTVELRVGVDCALTAPSPTAEALPDDETAEVGPISAGPDLTWLWWVLGALVLAVLIAVVVLVLRRRGAAE